MIEVYYREKYTKTQLTVTLATGFLSTYDPWQLVQACQVGLSQCAAGRKAFPFICYDRNGYEYVMSWEDTFSKIHFGKNKYCNEKILSYNGATMFYCTYQNYHIIFGAQNKEI